MFTDVRLSGRNWNHSVIANLYLWTIIIVFHMLKSMVAKTCQLLPNSSVQPHRLWLTQIGEQLPPSTFRMQPGYENGRSRQEFDSMAASNGLHQMHVTPDGESFWVQQICIDELSLGKVPDTAKVDSSYLKPLFRGLNGLANPWCIPNGLQTQWLMETENLGAIIINPVFYHVQCVERVGVEEPKFLVRMQLEHTRWVYQCLKIKLMSGGLIIQMVQSVSFSLEPDLALCSEKTRTESVIWLPSLNAPTVGVKSDCLIQGGFQLTSIQDLRTNKLFCDYQSYATLESGCVYGEGMEWTFDDVECNFFESAHMSKFGCYAYWKTDKYKFVIIYKKRKGGGHTFFSMVFSEVPGLLTSMEKHYQKSVKMWISPGTILASDVLDQIAVTTGISSEEISNFLQRSYKEIGQNRQVIELDIRRAFGSCDDERTTCDKGCEHDARNRLFCYRTCVNDERRCESQQWDSCTFGSNYQGIWDLITPKESSRSGIVTPTYRKELTLSIGRNQVEIFRSNERNGGSSFTCVREVGETIRDWFIIRTFGQRNGCRPRDICLELYQSGLKRSFTERNTNSMQYRLSHSQAAGTDVISLCRFDESALNHVNSDHLKMSPEILVKRLHSADFDRPYALHPMKCGIYQIRMSGTVHVNERFFSELPTSSPWIRKTADPWTNESRRYARSPEERSGSTESLADMKENHPDNQFQSDIKLRNPRTIHSELNKYTYSADYGDSIPPYPTPQYVSPTRGKLQSCPIELTDFNRSFGSTGEFDYLLRVRAICSNQKVNFLLNGTHQCISVYNLEPTAQRNVKYKLILTYRKKTGEYFCWLFMEANPEGRKHFFVYLFETPQCRYRQLPAGGIEVYRSAAILQMDVTADSCPSCQSPKIQQRPLNAEPIESQTEPTLRVQVSKFKQRQTLRSLQRNSASLASKLYINFLLKMGFFCFWFHYLSFQFLYL